MINNFEQIKKLLSFNSDDEFYFVQILQRKKDNPGNVNGSNNSSRLIKAYYIDSIEKLNKQQDEMIQLANLFNARVGINLNKRSYYKTAFNTLQTFANQMHNKEFKYLHRTYNTACGVHNGVDDKIWLLDVDDLDPSSIIFDMFDDPEARRYSALVHFINNAQPVVNKNKVICTIPSKSGYHLITTGFDTREFNKEFPDVCIHKNNPTNLYIP